MKIHIVSGFLGAGKTTFINKWLPHIKGKVCLIENEFGDISVDSRLFPHQVHVKEIYAGCICCNLVGSLRDGIKEIYALYSPDHLIIEPSGVGALSEILKVCQRVIEDYPLEMTISNIYTMVDVTAYEDYAESFGAFYLDQIKTASMILFSYSNHVDQRRLEKIHKNIASFNKEAQIVSEDWLKMDDLVFETYLSVEHKKNRALINKRNVAPADNVLSSYSVANPRHFTIESFTQVFECLGELTFGKLIRAKGVVKLKTGQHVHFDYTPFHKTFRIVEPSIKPGIAFIGKMLNKSLLRAHFAKSIKIVKVEGD